MWPNASYERNREATVSLKPDRWQVLVKLGNSHSALLKCTIFAVKKKVFIAQVSITISM